MLGFLQALVVGKIFSLQFKDGNKIDTSSCLLGFFSFERGS